MSNHLPRDPFANSGQLPRGADLCMPTIFEGEILGLAAAQQGVELSINQGNLAAGVESIGLAAPLECMIDVPRDSVGIFNSIHFSIDEAAGAGRVVLPFASAELASRKAMRLANSALWLSSIVTQKAFGAREFNFFGANGAVRANLLDTRNRKAAYKLAKRFPVIQRHPLKLA